jgi:hypothetical protein
MHTVTRTISVTINKSQTINIWYHEIHEKTSLPQDNIMAIVIGYLNYG